MCTASRLGNRWRICLRRGASMESSSGGSFEFRFQLIDVDMSERFFLVDSAGEAVVDVGELFTGRPFHQVPKEAGLKRAANQFFEGGRPE